MERISPYRDIYMEGDHRFHQGRHRHRTETDGDVQATNSNGSSTAAAAKVSRQSLDVTIVTAEGDRVTINTSSTVTSAAATYKASNNGNSTQASASSSSSSFNASVTIEGNLSQDELSDIAKALQAYGKALKDALAGKPEPAAAQAGQIANLDAIASFDATFTAQQAVTTRATAVSQAA
jgi:hypothetical protein